MGEAVRVGGASDKKPKVKQVKVWQCFMIENSDNANSCKQLILLVDRCLLTILTVSIGIRYVTANNGNC